MSSGAPRGAPPEPQFRTPPSAPPHPSDPDRRDPAPAGTIAADHLPADDRPRSPDAPAGDAATPERSRPDRHRGPRPRTSLAVRLAPSLAVAVTLLPALHVIWRTATGDLGSDPIETLEHATGDWAIRFLIVTLAITPLRQATGWGWLVRLRRTFGLAVFAYATVHLLVYLVLDMGLMGGEIVKDVLEHPWVTLGMTSWLLLLPLAVTSTRGWVRRLGGRRWQRLHRLIYIVPVTASLHYFWAVKKDVSLPVLFAAILALLLGVRLWRELARRRGRLA